MQTVQESATAIFDLAKRVYSLQELQTMSRPQLSLLMGMLKDRLAQPEPIAEPELEGFRELHEMMWHPGLNLGLDPSQGSATTASPTSGSAAPTATLLEQPSARAATPAGASVH